MQHKIKKTIGIIPARYASVRFPGKPLVNIAGKTMIQRVCEQTAKVHGLSDFYVATDDERIFDHVNDLGFRVLMTASSHRSGTDRCAEVVRTLADKEITCVVNIQGDEPFINPRQIEQLIHTIQNENTSENIATLIKRITATEDLFNPNIVKVVPDSTMRAMYFSRSPIPFVRGAVQKDWLTNQTFYKHIGLYAYRADTLEEITKLPAGRLEQAESLEQLRWAENGYAIRCGITEYESKGIDTPEDLSGM